jgi:hypothetical protein
MKKIIIASAAVTALIAAIYISFGFSEVKNNVKSEDETKAVILNADNMVTVKEYMEKIGLFNPGETKPFTILDVFTFTLPERDKEILKDGFTVPLEGIWNVIEDYTG